MALAGCEATSEGPRDRRAKVVAGFYPLAYAAREIAGPRARVENLTPPGAEPHDLEVSPRDVEKLRAADLVLLLGHGFQPQLERAAGTGERVLRLLDTPGLGPLAGGDPHVWLDPLRFATIVRRIGRALGDERAAGRLVKRLNRLDRAYRDGLGRCERREIVTSHDAFGYLARRYRLRQVPIGGLSPEGEPAPRDLERAIERVRGTGATTVYFEKLVSPKLALTVARETGASTAVLDPLEGLTPADERRGSDYFTAMRANLASLRRGLECR